MRRLHISLAPRFGVIFVFLVLTACGASPRKFVPLSATTDAPAAPTAAFLNPIPLRVAVAAVISPRSTLESYDALLDYLSRQLERPVQLVQRQTYAEVNELVRTGQVDIAFVCGGAYVEGQRDFGLELLVAPQINGATIYYSYLIVPNDSSARALNDLRGKVFAFSDPLSNSGRLAPAFQIRQFDATPETFFARTIFTYSHDNSIRAVAAKLVDGAAVDSLVYDALVASNEELASKTRIIEKSPPFGIPPVVVPPALNAELKTQLRNALLKMDSDAEGRAALARLRIDRFVLINDHAYDSIREMARVVRGWSK
ncbi:MAG: phosphate/phosphite/phosphonate ABC transporter substrate-binding protein [Chloroflexi bacterium]|nr:phosphate/phosphite/phosphonate ABC transporter substrate-binding protein [Chloroflexota bacterium]